MKIVTHNHQLKCILTNIYDIEDEISVVGRVIHLTKDYTTGNETFKKGSIETVIEATSRKDRKWKVSLDNDTKKYRLLPKIFNTFLLFHIFRWITRMLGGQSR